MYSIVQCSVMQCILVWCDGVKCSTQYCVQRSAAKLSVSTLHRLFNIHNPDIFKEFSTVQTTLTVLSCSVMSSQMSWSLCLLFQRLLRSSFSVSLLIFEHFNFIRRPQVGEWWASCGARRLRMPQLLKLSWTRKVGHANCYLYSLSCVKSCGQGLFIKYAWHYFILLMLHMIYWLSSPPFLRLTQRVDKVCLTTLTARGMKGETAAMTRRRDAPPSLPLLLLLQSETYTATWWDEHGVAHHVKLHVVEYYSAALYDVTINSAAWLCICLCSILFHSVFSALISDVCRFGRWNGRSGDSSQGAILITSIKLASEICSASPLLSLNRASCSDGSTSQVDIV